MLNRALSEAGDGAGSAPEWVRVPSCGLAGQPASSLPSTAQPPQQGARTSEDDGRHPHWVLARGSAQRQKPGNLFVPIGFCLCVL